MATDTVAEVKSRLSIEQVVGAHVKLKRAGKSLSGLCPFHKEKTSSFHVSPDRGTFHCFGCGVGGDIFTFTEKIEGVDFKGALKILAERAGVALVFSNEGGQVREKKDRLVEAMARAEKFFIQNLIEGGEAYKYALSRGLTKETISAWGIGYAPDEWRSTLEALIADGFTTKELLDAGLIKEADGKPGTYYDRFRNRLMFPIKDPAARTVAFTGRALSADDQAKYLNSPETELFKKSNILFALDRAKDAIRTRGFTILMEGQMDVLHAHQAGFANTVAVSGTALTREHLTLLKRYSDNLMLCLDADKAGLAASVKSAMLALNEGMRVKAVHLPKGKDPADVIQEDPKHFTKLVTDAPAIVEFFLNVLAESESSQHRLVLLVEKTVLPLLYVMRSPLEREHFVGITARFLGTSPEAVRGGIQAAFRKYGTELPEDAGASPEPQNTTQTRLSASEALTERLKAIILTYPNSALAKRVEIQYSRVTGSPIHPEGVSERILFESGITFGESPAEDAADDLIKRFEKTVLDEAYTEALTRLRKYQRIGNTKEAEDAENACSTLAKQIASLS